MTSSLLRTAVTVLLALAPALVLASRPDHNRYKWRDAQGHLHYSDSLPPEAVRFGYEVINPHGIVVRRVERARTEDELAADRRQAAVVAAAHEREAEQQRADAQLLAGYPTEADLIRTQRQKLDLLMQHVQSAQVSLRSQERGLADQLERAAEVERSGKALNARQQEELDAQRRLVDRQRQLVERRQAEHDQAQLRFVDELDRYRQLRDRD